jgi:hypothetical protein
MLRVVSQVNVKNKFRLERRKLMCPGNLVQLIPQFKPCVKTGIKLLKFLKYILVTIKPLWKPKRNDVDEALLKWYKEKRSVNVPVSCLLMATAKELARRLVVDTAFVCASEWIDRLKLRHISREKENGEARAAN